MVKYIDGNLLKLADEGHFDVIAHGANCFCVMESGIAPQIKAKYPDAYTADCATTKGDINKLGTISYAEMPSITVVNIYSQFDTKGRRQGKMDLDYDALRSGLKLMKERYSGKRFGLPYIGTGLAGGDEAKVMAIIEEEMRGEYVTMVRYTPNQQ
jgi:O-acetyl-ADP-ribose deacetylase (regulator of RNase III)